MKRYVNVFENARMAYETKSYNHVKSDTMSVKNQGTRPKERVGLNI